MADVISEDQIRIVPATQAWWKDIQEVLGTRDYAARCQCRRLEVAGWIWRDSTLDQRAAMLRSQTACGNPQPPATSGLVAYVGAEPARWAAAEPRTAYLKLRTPRIP
ncbi:MAG: family N-acetyltransferase [Rhizobacter sp.]|nr:family N-acetyltransferase [Rhizobacter sp.]